jgi:hypothetical protein
MASTLDNASVRPINRVQSHAAGCVESFDV